MEITYNEYRYICECKTDDDCNLICDTTLDMYTKWGVEKSLEIKGILYRDNGTMKVVGKYKTLFDGKWL